MFILYYIIGKRLLSKEFSMDDNEELKYTYICTVCGKKFETTSPLQDVCDECAFEIGCSMSPKDAVEKEWYEYFD